MTSRRRISSTISSRTNFSRTQSRLMRLSSAFSAILRSKQQEISGSLPVDRQDPWRKEAQDHFSDQTGQDSSHHHGLAHMKTRKTIKKTTAPDRETIDQ